MSPLLQPLPLGRPGTNRPALPNRIVFGAHVTNFGQGNLFTARHRAYYRERAAGGAGLIVTEALTVHPLDWPYEHIPFGHQDAIVPSLRALADELRVAAQEAGHPPPLILAQLNHTGGQTHGRLLRQSPWAPSAVPDVASKKMPRVMDTHQIDEVVQGFSAAAARVRQGGLDGVELNAAQYALLRQFLSPLTNFRADEYGGSLENRLRLLARVIAEVRRALGPGPVLGVKLTGDELAPWGGLTPEHCAGIAQALTAVGGLDYLSVQIGGPYSAQITDAGMPTPQAHAAPLAENIRRAVAGALPVFAEGRIESPQAAESVLAQGQADACVMTRALISDPDLPRKLAGAGPEPIRPHVGMNRYFLVKGDWNRPLGDLANPRAGREARLPRLAPGAAARAAEGAPVLVIGGGPAGMEAALTLARLGRRPHLVEAGPALGGMAERLAAQQPTRAEFGPLVEWYRAMLDRLGVRVELNRAVDGGEPWLADYARILIATGAEAPPAPWPLPAGLCAVTPRGLFAPGARERLPPPAAGRALVIDSELGFRMGNAVEWLLDAGYGVDVATEDFFVGRELVESGELLWFNRVAPRGAALHPRLRAGTFEREATRSSFTAILRDRFSGQECRIPGLALVVYAAPERPATIPPLQKAERGPGGEGEGRTLREILRARGLDAETIGDARAPRLMGEAILHAHQTARE